MTPPAMLQNEQEFAAFLGIVCELGARSYLEVGAKFGGSLYRVGMCMPTESECVAVDMPSGTKVWPESERSLRNVAEELTNQGRPCSVFWGDSTDPKIIAAVRAKRPSFDIVFIDANHTIDYVRKDWATYGPMAAKAVVFHDISWWREPGWKGTPIHVPQFWQEIKGSHHHQELRYDHTRRNNGIGVIYV